MDIHIVLDMHDRPRHSSVYKPVLYKVRCWVQLPISGCGSRPTASQRE